MTELILCYADCKKIIFLSPNVPVLKNHVINRKLSFEIFISSTTLAPPSLSLHLALSLSLYIYIYIYVCVCVCVCVFNFCYISFMLKYLCAILHIVFFICLSVCTTLKMLLTINSV